MADSTRRHIVGARSRLTNALDQAAALADVAKADDAGELAAETAALIKRIRNARSELILLHGDLEALTARMDEEARKKDEEKTKIAQKDSDAVMKRAGEALLVLLENLEDIATATKTRTADTDPVQEKAHGQDDAAESKQTEAKSKPQQQAGGIVASAIAPPRATLPRFSGLQPAEYSTFVSLFDSLTSTQRLSEIEKLQLLLTSLDEPARSIVAGYSIFTEGAYKDVRRTLEEEYGD